MIDLTKGPTFRNMILFSLPIMLQGSFQIIYNLVDRFWVGNLGSAALGAVTVGFPVFFFMIAIVFGVAIGAGIMIAQYKGANDKVNINLTARNFLVLGSLLVLIISSIFVIGTEKILQLLNTPDDVIGDATVYLRWIFGFMIAFFWFNATAGIIRGLGDSRTPTMVAAVTTVLNIILDPLLIYGYWGIFPRLEVAGAAIATVTVQVVGAIIMTILLARHKEYVDLRPKGFKFNLGILRDIARQGLPASGTMVMVSISMMVFMGLINRYGTYALAGYGIGMVLDSLLMMPAQALSMSMSTIAGQNVGAGKLERVNLYLKDAIRISVSIAMVGSIVLLLLAPTITKLFQPDNYEFTMVIPYVLTYITIMPVRYLSMSVFFPVNGAIRGAGDAVTSMILVAITQLIVRIPAAFIFAHFWGFAGVVLAIVLSTVVGATIVTLYYHTGRWERHAIVKQKILGDDYPIIHEPEEY